MKNFTALLLFLGLSTLAFAGKQFEIFDGQIYNGKVYPLVDIIEWGEADGELPHLEFHLHSKNNPMDISVVPGDKNGKPVLWVMYDLKFRSERICRHGGNEIDPFGPQRKLTLAAIPGQNSSSLESEFTGSTSFGDAIKRSPSEPAPARGFSTAGKGK